MYEANLGGAKSQRLQKVLLTAKTSKRNLRRKNTPKGEQVQSLHRVLSGDIMKKTDAYHRLLRELD